MDITLRDATVLRWVGEMYTARLDVFGALLARNSTESAGSALSRRTVRTHLDRWERMGVANTVRLLGGSWVVPTRRGLDVADLAFRTWEPKPLILRHTHATAVVRLSAELDMNDVNRWISEREIRRGRTFEGGVNHIPDGAVPIAGDESQLVYIEVELASKSEKQLLEIYDLPDVVRRGVVYFCPEKLCKRIGAKLEKVLGPRGVKYQVRTLPELPSVSAGGAW